MPLWKFSLPLTDLEAGWRANALIESATAPHPGAVTIFEESPGRFSLAAYYERPPTLAALAAALAAGGVASKGATLAAVPDANWVALSQASLAPVRAGRLLVHGSHDRGRVGARQGAIEIEAGEAFGTGHNATTALCLEALDRLTRGRVFARVLDLGCGSGILAIAAARLVPSARVLACDSDPVAVTIARANARLNRVGARVRILTAVSFAHSELRAVQPFDLVLANILPQVLIEMAPDLKRRLSPGGIAVLSGILDSQAREVAGVYGALGLKLIGRHRRDGWTMLTLALG